MASNARVNSI